MKNFFTLFIATVLLSLCLLEKEARKNALLVEETNKNLVDAAPASFPLQADQAQFEKSEFQSNNHLVANEGIDIVDSQQSMPADSLSFLKIL